MRYKHIIEIQAKEWFDRVNGNSYFSANVYIDDDLVAELPFQYGYGDHYIDMAFQEINGSLHEREDLLSPLLTSSEPVNSRCYSQICDNNNIKLITFKQENCKKREL